MEDESTSVGSKRRHFDLMRRKQKTMPKLSKVEKNRLLEENARVWEESARLSREENARLREKGTQLCKEITRLQDENDRLLEENTFLRSNTVADIQKQTPLITPGEPTLEEAGMKYIEQTEYALYELSEKITDFPKEKSRKFCSLIFEEAYDNCKCHLLKEFNIKLETLVTMPADRGLESCLTADEEEHYSDLQRAYGLLLSACKIKGSLAPVDQVTEKIKLKHKTSELLPHFLPVINDAVRIAWKMLILLPPAVLCTPEKFFEEWQSARDFPDVKKRYYTLTYYRPLMLSHAHGPQVVKAMVKKVASSERTPNEESDFEDDEEEARDKNQPKTNETNEANVDQKEASVDQKEASVDQNRENNQNEASGQTEASDGQNQENEPHSGDHNGANDHQNDGSEDQNGLNENQNGEVMQNQAIPEQHGNVTSEPKFNQEFYK